jgi:hypothetical protein
MTSPGSQRPLASSSVAGGRGLSGPFGPSRCASAKGGWPPILVLACVECADLGRGEARVRRPRLSGVGGAGNIWREARGVEAVRNASWTAFWSVSVALMLSAARASAEPTPAAKPVPAAEPVPSAEPPPSAGVEVERALEQADARFVAGDLQGALEILEPVCERSDAPECSFSLGAVHHGLGHCTEALVHYRRYREVAPQGEHIREVTEALEEVESRCGQGAAAGSVVGASAAAGPIATATAPAQPRLSPAVSSSSLVAGSASPNGTSPLSAPPSVTSRDLMTGSFVLSGAAAASSIVFGVLAARSAGHCDRAHTYDREFVSECEEKGPAYQGLWQGFAVASGAFLGIGLSIWWLDADRSASVAVTSAGSPLVRYQGRF